MLKLSNESKVGILAVIAIALGFWGFKFLKGINVLTTSQTFYIKYDNVDQLRPSSPVFVKGYQVGMVKDVYVDRTTDTSIIVVINVESRVDIPKNAVATIISQSLMGGKALDIVIKEPCSGDDCAQSGDYLQGASKSFLETIVGSPAQLDAYTGRLRSGLTINLDSLARANPDGFAGSLQALDHSLKNIEKLTAKLDALMAASAKGLQGTISNTNAITGALNSNMSDIDSMLKNLRTISAQMKGAGLDQSALKATAAIDSVTVSLAALRGTLGSTQRTINRVDTLAQGLIQGKGLAGKALTDEALYENLVSVSRHLYLLEQDIRLNPKRYNTVKLKIFGNKRRPYQSPIDDPAYRHLVDSLERQYDAQRKGN